MAISLAKPNTVDEHSLVPGGGAFKQLFIAWEKKSELPTLKGLLRYSISSVGVFLPNVLSKIYTWHCLNPQSFYP